MVWKCVSSIITNMYFVCEISLLKTTFCQVFSLIETIDTHEIEFLKYFIFWQNSLGSR